MAQLRTIVTLALAYLLVLVAFPPRALAYLDPGTGSYLVQVLVASLLAIALTIRVFWQNIKLFFQRLFRRRSAPVAETPDEQ